MNFPGLMGLCLAFTLHASLVADTLKFVSGGSIECTVLQEQKESVLIQYGSGTMTVSRSIITEIIKSPPPPASKTTAQTEASKVETDKLPTWATIIQSLSKQAWATDLQQIPATVIDTGVMRNVPYKSFKCGADYEINVYGDPENPAGFEIGVYRKLLQDEKAKKNCVEFIAGLLPRKTDSGILRALNLKQDSAVHDGLTIEITPETAEDAYGGWWISIYREAELDKTRASDAELAEISDARSDIVKRQESKSATKEKAKTQTPASAPSTSEDLEAWKPEDIKRARVVTNTTKSTPSATPAPADSGRVYVRGYYRKDGTYVSPHTRKK